MQLEEAGQASVDYARMASEEMERGNLRGAKTQLAKAKVKAGRHMKDIKDLIDRYTVKEELYKQQERELTANINNVHAREQSVDREICAAKVKLDSEKSELGRHTRDLSSAEGHLNYLQKKMKRKKRKAKRLHNHVKNAVKHAFGKATSVDQAKAKVGRCQNGIADTKQRISQSEGKISSLSTTISQLRSQKLHYMTQRSCLQEEKGKMKEVNAFLLDAQSFWNTFSTAAESCINRTALVRQLLKKAKACSYSLFDSNGTKKVLATFAEAWDTFEEMNENGRSYVFKRDFQCTRCNSTRKGFPHVNNGQLICSSCH